jgi:hypothetical protein
MSVRPKHARNFNTYEQLQLSLDYPPTYETFAFA